MMSALFRRRVGGYWSMRRNDVADVVEESKEALIERRRQILRQLGLTERDLAARAKAGSMTTDEWGAWEELRNIEFLLGE